MYLYGPVLSRRLGYSLGVDIVPLKTCTFNCIYCQLGTGQPKSNNRESYINLDVLFEELDTQIPKIDKLDYITLAGSGEPTLNSDIGEIINHIKEKYPDKKIAVITNSTLLNFKEVRDEIKMADLIVPSLDAGNEISFLKINRPTKEITFTETVDGLIKLRNEFNGHMRLEIMLLKDYNDDEQQLTELSKLVQKIRPDEIDINIPARPPAEDYAKIPDDDRIERAKKILHGELVKMANNYSDCSEKSDPELETKIVDLLSRRPETLEAMKAVYKSSNIELVLMNLIAQNRVYKEIKNGQVYYNILNQL